MTGVVEKAEIEKVEEGEMNKLVSKEQVIKARNEDRVMSKKQLVDEVKGKLNRNVIKDHFL